MTGNTRVDWRFTPLQTPIETSREVVDVLSPLAEGIMPGWPQQVVSPSTSTVEARIRLHLQSEGYRRESPWLEKPAIYADPVNALCDLIVDLVHAYIAEHPELLCLHSAAVAGSDGLILFPATYNAGKSTLASALVATGYRLFGDDVIPLHKERLTGMALGIQPRLRLPVPDNLEHHLRHFIELVKGPASDRFLYLSLQPDQLAEHGEQQPIRQMVLLNRDPAFRRAQLHQEQRDEVLKQLILRNFARENAAPEILQRLFQLVSQAQCLRLDYSDPQQACDLLRQLHPPFPQLQSSRAGNR